MYSRIEIERSKIEAEKLYSVESRIIYIALFFWGFIGLPFFFLGNNKKGFIYVLVSLLTFILIPLFAPNIIIGFSIFAYSIFYIYDYIKTFKKLGLKQSENELKRLRYTKEIIEEKKNSEEGLSYKFDSKIEMEILKFEIKNKAKESRVAGTLWWFCAFLGLPSFYVNDKKNGIIFILLWILYLLLNVTIGSSENLALKLCFLLFIMLHLSYYFYQGFKLNDKLERCNDEIRRMKLLMLRDLEKELIEKEVYKKNTETIENL